MKRSYYKNKISNFLKENSNSILGQLCLNHSNRTLEDLQRNSWIKQIEILKNQLCTFEGTIYFEFGIPRMGKRADNIVIIDDTIFVIEFKVGGKTYDKNAITQVIDYTQDLINFHEGSHFAKLVPILIVTNAHFAINNKKEIYSLKIAAKCNKENLSNVLTQFIDKENDFLNSEKWENSIYKPTPTIIEAAKALYKGHSVKEISRSDSGAINLSKTSFCINQIIDDAKRFSKKSICFVTGVPGAGKTLAGLNIANERMKADKDEHAVFLSGNGPLVEVLREALTRDIVTNSKRLGISKTKDNAKRETYAFIQNIHHFRDEYLKHKIEPTEKVVVFDEAQRAWNKKQVSLFMKRKKGIENFEMSEPEFLIDVMNRHKDWCIIICLIGGGQEINTGEAGLEEWINSLAKNYPKWEINYSNLIKESDNYLKTTELKEWLKNNAYSKQDLHLSVPIRSFRSEKLADFIEAFLNLEKEKATNLYLEIQDKFPIFISRNIEKAKNWLRKKAKGSERIGLIASSGARRLRSIGINVKNEISAPIWFLNDKEDVRSSYFLEEIATEFDIQGLEIDYTFLAWGANFYIQNNKWNYQKFKGTKWQKIRKDIDKNYLKNTYRVLLTRARQGMVIFLPESSEFDITRNENFYLETWSYFKEIGIKEI